MKQKYTLQQIKFYAEMIVCIMMLTFSAYSAIPIGTIEELQKIGDDPNYPLNGEYELTQDIDASGTRNWNNGAGFRPIGTLLQPFTGKLFGNGYKIKDFYINRPALIAVGLFAYLGQGSKVQNVGFVNAWVAGKGVVGALAGYCSLGGEIDSCFAEGRVTGTEEGVGLLVGTNDGFVKNSYAKGIVFGPSNIGGLLGINNGGVSNSYSLVSIEGTDNVAGLVGKNTKNIIQCYSDSRVIGSNSVGGLVGQNDGTVQLSYSFGNLSGNEGIGGVVGKNTEKGRVVKCYSFCSVKASSRGGGLIGQNEIGIIDQSFASGPVTITGNYAGGLVGSNTGGSITQCYATGNVNGKSYVGGLVGINEPRTGILVETVNPKVSQCYSVGLVSGSDRVGGLVGSNSKGATVSYCYWDTDTSKQTSSSAGTGLTSSKMKRKDSFELWDFMYVWGIVDNTTYPYLQWWQPQVRNYVGQNESTVWSAITGSGLVPSVIKECNDSFETGVVFRQGTDAGASVRPGDVINIFVSKGPCSTQTDDDEDDNTIICGCRCGKASPYHKNLWKMLLDFITIGVVLLTLTAIKQQRR